MPKSTSATRLNIRYLDDEVMLTKTHAWTWVSVPLQSYEFLTYDDRVSLALQMTSALSALVTSTQDPVDVHLRVIRKPLNVASWERQLESRVDTWGPAPGWNRYREEMAKHLRTFQFERKLVYLGVCLGPRKGKGSAQFSSTSSELLAPMEKVTQFLSSFSVSPDDVISEAEIEAWAVRARDVRRTLGQSAIHAVPARNDEIADLIAYPLWPGLRKPPSSLTGARTWGPGEVRALTSGIVVNQRRWIEVEQVTPTGDVETGFGATLCVSRFPDVLRYPEVEPWIHFISSTGLPVDFSLRMQVVPSQKVKKDISKKLADARDQASNIAGSGSSMPLNIREQLEVATALEYQIDKDRMPWLYGRHRLNVYGNSPEELTANAKSVIEAYRDLSIDISWPTGDQFDLMLESIPGGPIATRAYYQRQELPIIGGGMATATSEVGDRRVSKAGWIGPYLGYTTSRVVNPVFFSPHVAMSRNQSPGVAITGAPGGGKALALDTPVPTPTGWSTMGEIRVGDQVLDENGTPCTVLEATSVMTDRPCFRFTFADGTTLTADAQHQWAVAIHGYDPDKHPEIPAAEETPVYAAFPTARTETIHSLITAASSETHSPEGFKSQHAPSAVSLLINGEEKILTYWPTSAFHSRNDSVERNHGLRIMTSEAIFALLQDGNPRNVFVPVAKALQLPDQELPIEPYAFGLRIAGREDSPPPVAGIPLPYLRASLHQRRALWEALTTTRLGGDIGRSSGRLTFASREMARDVRALAISLGIQASVAQSPEGFCVIFAEYPTEGLALNKIVSVERIESVPVRCIMVDSPSHLFLAGETMIPTHNSFLAFTLAYQMAVQGVWTIYIDPKADAKPMGQLPGLPNPRVFDLRDGNDGILDPFSLGEQRSESTLLALETLRLLLGGSVSEEREEALLNAVEVVASQPEPSLTKVVDVLLSNTESTGARNLGTVLKTIRDLPFARLCFAPTGGARIRPEDGLTVVTLLGLDLPAASTRPDDYSYENRLAVSVMYLLTRYARQLMLSMDKSHPKAICIDEAWAITTTPQGAKLIPEIARMGRSHNTALVLVSQNAGDLMSEAVTNSISTKFAYRSTDSKEISDVLDLFGIAQDQNYGQAIRGLRNGECLMRDIDGRVSRVQVDSWEKNLWETFNTNPETRGKGTTAGDGGE
jgi:hypothetical protein